MAQISNIDDVLLSAKTNTQPATPEHFDDPAIDVVEPAREEPDLQSNDTDDDDQNNDVSNIQDDSEDDAPPPSPAASEPDVDEYGNEKVSSKKYTEDEVNERINQAVRDRIARFERNSGQQQQQQQQNTAQIQQAAQQGFQYDDKNPESWQQQLETFVEQTVARMSQKQAQKHYQLREEHAQAEFEQKFVSGMQRFADYKEVVGSHNITDAMTLASRSLKDPAAFFYATCKRAPQEIARIAQINDPYAQMVEIGKLEERMRQGKPAATTKTPKPINKIKEDDTIPYKTKPKEKSIEQRIAEDAARRTALQNSRRRR